MCFRLHSSQLFSAEAAKKIMNPIKPRSKGRYPQTAATEEHRAMSAIVEREILILLECTAGLIKRGKGASLLMC